MDLRTIERVDLPRTRDEIRVGDGVAPLGGGTWLYSTPHDHLRGLVDLTALGWTPWEAYPDGGLSIAATCSIADLVAIPARPGWRALPLFAQCARSLLASFKVWPSATVGGNIATALAAGGIISLGATLDAELVLWGPGDVERRVPVADFVLAQQRTVIRDDEVIRSVEFAPGPLAAQTAFRRIALSPLGRAGTVVSGRRDTEGGTVVVVTGGTTRPEVLRFAEPPAAEELARAVDGIDSWFTDAHGAADWRRAMSVRYADDVRRELASDFTGRVR